MKKSEVLDEVNNSLLLYEDMFVNLNGGGKQVASKNYPFDTEGGARYHSFYYPGEVPPDSLSGFQLVSGKGFISIKQEYKYRNIREMDIVSYVYRFISPEMRYSCEYHDPSFNSLNALSYNFHYDMDLEYSDSINENHPECHLQVLHSHPRFKTERISVVEFLRTVKMLCFKNNDTSEPYLEPVYMIS